MGIFRVVKTKDYTVMSNYHLKDSELSLRGKGLLSVMLSLPDDWDYTIRGLAAILAEGERAVATTLKELEAMGYLERNVIRDKKGKIMDTEYIIYEHPVKKEQETVKTKEIPEVTPQVDFPLVKCADVDRSRQLNTKELNTKVYSNQSICKKIDEDRITTRREIREELEENIDYAALVIDEPENRDIVDECLSVMTDVLEEGQEKIRISGRSIPYRKVKERFMKIKRMHIDYVLESLRNTGSNIKNIRAYLIAALYNSTATINLYYRQKTQHDMFAGLWNREEGYCVT